MGVRVTARNAKGIGFELICDVPGIIGRRLADGASGVEAYFRDA